MSQRQIADELGVSPGGVNYCLRALAEIGWIKVGNFAKSGHKLGYLYLLTPRGIKEKTKITASFLANKLDSRLKAGEVKKKKPAKPGKGMGLSKPALPPIPKSRNLPKPQDSVSGMPQATSTSISQADYDKVKPMRPIDSNEVEN